jgi:sec-independent protein translocase protein TatC
MPRFGSDDDLFGESTMTFGQHLEELRICLFRAIVGLVLGCVLGLIIGGPVVNFIQTPLRKALTAYYAKQATTKSFNEGELQKLAEAGFTSPKDIDRVQKIIRTQSVSFDVVYVDAQEILGQLDQARAPQPAPASAPVVPQAAPPIAKAPPPAPASAVPAAAAPAEAAHPGLKPLVLFRPVADDPRTRVKSLNAQEAFMIYMKASLLVGAVLASPWIFYQIWFFVAAGLYPHERRYIHIFLPCSVGLFLTGASMAFFLVFEKVLEFLFSFNAYLGIDPEPRISEWMSFVLLLPLGFGISFQLPLVMLFMERIGIFTVEAYLSSWRISVLAIFVLAMLLTPTGDPYSMLLMAGPLTVLYFAGVALCHFIPRRPSRFETGG